MEGRPKTFGMVFVFVAMVLCAQASWSAVYEEPFEQMIPQENATKVEVGNRNGTIRVEGWDNPEIAIEAIKRVRNVNRRDADRLFEELRIEIHREGGTIQVETVYPEGGRKGFWGGLFGSKPGMSVEYNIRVPKKLDVGLRTTNGKLELSDVAGNLDLSSTNGSLSVQDVQGDLRGRTTNGAIRVSELTGTFDVHTTNGAIDIQLTAAGVGDLKARTTNGAIVLRVPPDLSVEVDASTSNGRVRCDLPIQMEGVRSKKRLRGSLNKGGPSLELRTTNGAIEIRSDRSRTGDAELRRRTVEERRARTEKRFVRRSKGDVVRFIGNVTIEEDEAVQGDVVTIGGDVRISGSVDGDAVAVFGDVDVGPRAVVYGDVVSVGGETVVAKGARIGGQVVETSFWHGISVNEYRDRGGMDFELDWDREGDKAISTWTSTPPRIDGWLDDPAWGDAEPIGGFVRADGGYVPSEEQTDLYFLWDKEFLYIGAKCFDRDMGDLVMNQRRRDAPVWHDDDVEIFLSQDEDPEPYYQFAVNPAGTLTDQKKQRAGDPDRLEWSTDARVAARLEAHYWGVEMAIPWASIGGPPEEGERRRFNAFRDSKPRPNFSYWSPTYRTNPSPHVPSQFGVLTFTRRRTHAASWDTLTHREIRCSGIEIEGNKQISTDEIMGAIGLSVGDPIARTALWRIEDDLWAMNWFRDVQVVLKDTEEGATVLVRVREKPILQVQEIVLSGAEVFSASELMERLDLKPGRYTEEAVDRWCERIQNLYEQKGYRMATVRKRYDPVSGQLTVDVDEGHIMEIRIEGTHRLRPERIRATLDIREGEIYIARRVEDAVVQMEMRIGKLESAHHRTDEEGVLTVVVREKKSPQVTQEMDARYNRVEGLFLGPSFTVNTVFGPQVTLRLRGGYSFKLERWEGAFGVERSWFDRNRFGIGANWHDMTDTEDRWRIGDQEASALALLFGTETQDYFRRSGYELYVYQRMASQSTVRVGYQEDDYESLTKNTNWSLFHRKEIKRRNPPVDAGRMKSGTVSYTFDHKGNGDTWRFWAEAEMAGEDFGGDFDFKRYQAELRQTSRLSPSQSLALRARWGLGEGGVPPQKQFGIGGIGTLPGYGYEAFTGTRMVLLNLEYRMADALDDECAFVAFWGAGQAWEKGEKAELGDLKANVGMAVELGGQDGLRVGWAVPIGRPLRKGRWDVRFHQVF